MSAPLAAAAGRAQALLPSPLNWAQQTGRSRRRKSLSRRAGWCALGLPGQPSSQGAAVIAILPGNENERAGSGFHGRPAGSGEGRRRTLRERRGGGSGLPAWRRRSRPQPPARGRPLAQPGPGSLGHGGEILRHPGSRGNPWSLDSGQHRTNFMSSLCVSAFGREGTSQAVRLDQVPLPLGTSDLPGPDPNPACRWALWMPHHPGRSPPSERLCYSS